MSKNSPKKNLAQLELWLKSRGIEINPKNNKNKKRRYDRGK